MSVEVYELRFFRKIDDRVDEVEPRIRTALDQSDAGLLGDLMRRHLIAAAERAGLERPRAHLLYAELRQPDRHGRISDRDGPLFRWALPVLPDGVR